MKRRHHKHVNREDTVVPHGWELGTCGKNKEGGGGKLLVQSCDVTKSCLLERVTTTDHVLQILTV